MRVRGTTLGGKFIMSLNTLSYLNKPIQKLELVQFKWFIIIIMMKAFAEKSILNLKYTNEDLKKKIHNLMYMYPEIVLCVLKSI